MSILRTPTLVCVLIVVIVVSIGTALAGPPEAVSPGAIDRSIEVETPCPTFSWGLVPDAESYELIAYRLPEDMVPATLDLSHAEEVLFTRVPGAATSWTPDLTRCLAPGGSHIWFVRAVFDDEQEESSPASDWSYGRFFSVSQVPTAREVEEAIGVLRRYVASERGSDLERSGATAQPATDTAGQRDAAALSQPSLEGAKSVTSAPTAIKGHVLGVTGERYGVVGISDSATGAGLAAANTNGGPDLVLDGGGLASARITESGINRNWGTPVSFNIHNSGGGGMTLQVDGTPVQKRVTGGCSTNQAIKTITSTGGVTCEYDDFNSFTLYGPYTAGITNGGSNYAIWNYATSTNACFLSEVHLRDVDGSSEDAWCRVFVSSGLWTLEAHTDTGDDADAWCAMYCLQWQSR